MKRRTSLVRYSLVAITFLCLVSWLVSPQATVAHAELIKTNPTAGSLLDAPPNEIQLFLTESVSLDFSTVTVYDRDRREQPIGPLGHVSGDNTTVSIPLSGTLSGGTFTVAWRVLSSADGHLTSGSFAFRVRSASGTPEPEGPIVPLEGSGASGAPFAGSSENPDLLRWLVRAIILATAVFLLGGSILSVLVVQPTTEAGGDEGKALWSVVSKRYAGIASSAALLLVVSLLLDLLLQVAAVEDSGLPGALGHIDRAILTITSTWYGYSWALKAAAATALLGMMLFVRLKGKAGSSGIWEPAIAAGSLLVLGQSLGSHAAAVAGADHASGLPLPVINDWLHLTMVATWVGGLGYLALALFPSIGQLGLSPQERRAFLGLAIPRFSRLAILSVVGLAITGTINLAIHSTDLATIFSSQYGQLLTLKVALFLALVALGAVNLRRLSPQLRASNKSVPAGTGAEESTPVAQLRRNVRLEVGLACVVLLCTGGLTLLPPPTGTTGLLGAQANPSPTPVIATVDTLVAGYNVALTTLPSPDGDELTLTVSRVDGASPPLTDVLKVLFKVTPQDIDAGTTSYTANPKGSGNADSQTWDATGSFLTTYGGYIVTTVIQRTQAPDLKAAFRLDLAQDNTLTAAASQVVDIAVSTLPSPPMSGTAVLTVTLTDGARQPISGASVSITPLIPALGRAMPVVVAQPVLAKPGVYTVPILFDTVGSWLLILDVEANGQPPVKLDVSLDVAESKATPTP